MQVRKPRREVHLRGARSLISFPEVNLQRYPGQSREEVQSRSEGKSSIRTAEISVIVFLAWTGSSLHINRLNDVTRKKELDCPVHEHADFAFPTGQLCKVDSPPQEPSEQTGKPQGSASIKWNAQFSAGCLVSHHAESTERIDRKSV